MGQPEHERRFEVAYSFGVLWVIALTYMAGMVAWGSVIFPFNAYNDHKLRTLAIAIVLASACWILLRRSDELFVKLRKQPAFVLIIVAAALAVLWIDGGWRSSFYLLSYAPIGLAAVATDLRWTLGVSILLAVGYVLGLAINDFSWTELAQDKRDGDSVIANTGGYLIAAVAIGVPLEFLRGRGDAIAKRIAPFVGSSPGQVARTLATESVIQNPDARAFGRDLLIEVIAGAILLALSILLLGQA